MPPFGGIMSISFLPNNQNIKKSEVMYITSELYIKNSYHIFMQRDLSTELRDPPQALFMRGETQWIEILEGRKNITIREGHVKYRQGDFAAQRHSNPLLRTH